MSTPLRSRHRSRVFGDSYSEAGYRPYAIAIGQLILAWNGLHEKLGLLFVLLVQFGRPNDPADLFPENDDPHIARWAGLWSSAQFDRPKRAMLQALLNPILKTDLQAFPKLIEDMTWILKEADKLEDIRNNAVHAPLVWLGDHPALSYIIEKHKIDVIPDVTLANKRAMNVAAKAANKGLLREYRWARSACLILRDFTAQIGGALSVEGATWPRRPSLPNRGDRKKSRPAKRPGQTQGHQHPPRSSRG